MQRNKWTAQIRVSQIPDARSPCLQIFCAVLPNNFGSPLWNLFHVTPLYLEIWGGSYVFGKNFWTAGLDVRGEEFRLERRFHLFLRFGLWRRRFWHVLSLFWRFIQLPSSGRMKRKAACFSEIVLSIYQKWRCYESVQENRLKTQHIFACNEDDNCFLWGRNIRNIFRRNVLLQRIRVKGNAMCVVLSAPLLRHWGFVQAVRPIGGVEI